MAGAYACARAAPQVCKAVTQYGPAQVVFDSVMIVPGKTRQDIDFTVSRAGRARACGEAVQAARPSRSGSQSLIQYIYTLKRAGGHGTAACATHDTLGNGWTAHQLHRLHAASPFRGGA